MAAGIDAASIFPTVFLNTGTLLGLLARGFISSFLTGFAASIQPAIGLLFVDAAMLPIENASKSRIYMLASDRPRPGLNLVELNATIRNNATSNCSVFC